MSLPCIWSVPVDISHVGHESPSIDAPRPGITKVVLHWGPWNTLDYYCVTSRAAASQGIDYVYERLLDALQQPSFALTSAEEATDEQRIDGAETLARHLVFLSNRESPSGIECFYIGALEMLRSLNVTFGSVRLTWRMDELRRCLEMSLHDEYVHLMHSVKKQGSTEREALVPTANMALDVRTIARVRFV